MEYPLQMSQNPLPSASVYLPLGQSLQDAKFDENPAGFPQLPYVPAGQMAQLVAPFPSPLRLVLILHLFCSSQFGAASALKAQDSHFHAPLPLAKSPCVHRIRVPVTPSQEYPGSHRVRVRVPLGK